MYSCLKAINRVNGMRLGQIGKPSDWLISSDVDAKVLKEACGMEIVDVSIDDFFESKQDDL